MGSPTGSDRLLRGAVRHTAGTTTLLLLCQVAAAACSLAVPAVTGRALDLMLHQRPGASGWLTWAAALIAADIVLETAAVLLTQLTNARATGWIRHRALTGLLGTTVDRAAPLPGGDVAARLCVNATDSGTAPAALANAASCVLVPAGALVALALIDPWTAAVFVAGLPLLVLLLRTFSRDSSDAVGRYQHAQGAIAARLTEALAGSQTIAAADTARRERDRILAPLDGMARHGTHLWLVHGRAVARSGVLLPLLTTAVVAVAGSRLAAGQVSVGELLAASRYAALAAGIGGIAAPLGTLVRARSAGRRTAELAELPPMPHGEAALPAGGTGRLELRGVRVAREGAALLADITLTVEGGSTVAVVGRSGAGKSTLAAVAGRLADPDAGTVLLDGVDLASLTRTELREATSYAFARPAFDDDACATVRAALAAGAGPRRDPAAADRVDRAARAASADTFIRLLPLGYDTPLADTPLSGGEHQRLGLARAFAGRGRLIVLDDATSSLDTATERQVEKALATSLGPCTKLIVAHRVSTAARADHVIWLESGRVRHCAPHHRLWQDPDYRAVFLTDAEVPPPGRDDTAAGAPAPAVPPPGRDDTAAGAPAPAVPPAGRGAAHGTPVPPPLRDREEGEARSSAPPVPPSGRGSAAASPAPLPPSARDGAPAAYPVPLPSPARVVARRTGPVEAPAHDGPREDR
ncbi:ATP-binding cassette domain-containing protein [Streptomyces sp. t39]|uniref:ATP-binding cassette domain-containing protein n=1 Tax=Streptomyces sp. t39 TaxID=1828156 RepID=UPI0011CE9816|nr:ABC transporter ATP-binding protein [Streptomyces sp. t39]TXS50096.1 ABC transporter ATP-binding protein [Streptomyces sp. t39]